MCKDCNNCRSNRSDELDLLFLKFIKIHILNETYEEMKEYFEISDNERILIEKEWPYILGKFLGYKECCCKSFDDQGNKDRTDDQYLAHDFLKKCNVNSFIPCEDCSTKVVTNVYVKVSDVINIDKRREYITTLLDNDIFKNIDNTILGQSNLGKTFFKDYDFIEDTFIITSKYN